MASVYLLPLLLLSLSPLCLGWYYGDQRPYGNTHTTPPTYIQSQTSSEDDDDRRPPPRIDTGYGDTGTGQNSDAWNRAEQPQSQFDYKGSDSGYGNARTETLECGKDLYVSANQIINIQTSVHYGAQLLDGVYAYSFDGCVNACCEYSGCDLALYKTDGVSQTGKTCYFVHCGLPDHCQMVENNGFKAGFLISKPDYGELLDDHTANQEKSEEISHNSPSTPPPTHPVTTLTTTAPPITQTTPTEASTVVTMATTIVSDTTERPVTTATPASETRTTPTVTEGTEMATEATPTTATPTQLSEVNDSSVAPSNTPPSPSPEAHPTTPTNNESTTSKVVIDNATKAQKATEEYDECAKNGCAGGGLIAVSIIGTVLIIVLLVVAVVVTARIYKLKTRRQYRNVDYLINGMYT